MTRFARKLACRAIVLAAALPFAAAAAPVDDYIAARDKAVSDVVAAFKAGKGGDDATIKKEETAVKDLGKRMIALVGPLKLKGLGAPAYTLEGLLYGDDQPTRQLDGVLFSDKDGATQIVVAPQSVFQGWLAARAKDPEAPAAMRGALPAAAADPYFYNSSLTFQGGGYTPYLALPLAAADGETVIATLGLYSDEMPANLPPNQVSIVRLADGKAIVGLTEVKLDITPIAACDAVWKPFAARIDAMQKAVEKDNKDNDPRWEEIAKIGDDGSAAFAACFAREAPSQPFFPAAVKRAEALLATARGN